MEKQSKNWLWIGIIAVIVVGFLGVAISRVMDKQASQASFSEYDRNSIIEGNANSGGIGDHVKGSKDAPVVIFEYADYQCSACAGFNTRVNKLVEEYGDKVAVVYRSFLLNYHQNGTAAASAAEAAGLQGYWKEYADNLFANQSVWSNASGDSRTQIFADMFDAVTEGKGNRAKFISDMSSAEVKAKIDFDATLSKGLDIPGTPSFYMDGERIDLSNVSGAEAFSEFMHNLIDKKLEDLGQK